MIVHIALSAASCQRLYDNSFSGNLSVWKSGLEDGGTLSTVIDRPEQVIADAQMTKPRRYH